jgi:opacity protein-like surface antigen
MKKTLIALLAAGAFAASAQAQAPTWSGFKAGITLGASDYTNTWTDTSYFWYGGSLSYSKRQLAPAIHVGWDNQADSIVYGIELDHSFNSAKTDRVYSTSPGNPPEFLKADELKSVTTLRGRMGVALDSTLVYATAGVAKVKADHSLIRTSTPADDFNSFSNDHTGFAYGFGIEHRLNQMFSLRAEYQHVNIPEASAYNANNYKIEVGDEVSTFNFGASFHF